MGEKLDYLASRGSFVLGSNLLPFWTGRLYDHEEGRFVGFVDRAGVADASYPLNAILLSRLLWAYSVGYEETGDEECLALAGRAYETLHRDFMDPLFGGIFSSVLRDGTPLVLQKRTFAQAFFIIAVSRYARVSGDGGALTEAERLFDLTLRHAQVAPGGFTDVLRRDWMDDEDEHLWWMNRDGVPLIFNSQLHMLEGAIELEQAAPSQERRDQLARQIDFILHWFYRPATKHLSVSLHGPRIAADSTVNFANELEAAYLLRRAASLCGLESRVDEICISLVSEVMELARDREHGGLFFSFTPETGVLNRCKVWYVHAEAVVALLDAYGASGNDDYLTQARETWEYIEARLIDWEGGEWFASAPNPYTDPQSLAQQEARDRRTGPEKASAYKCPYHTVRVCAEIRHRVERLRVPVEKRVVGRQSRD